MSPALYLLIIMFKSGEDFVLNPSKAFDTNRVRFLTLDESHEYNGD